MVRARSPTWSSGAHPMTCPRSRPRRPGRSSRRSGPSTASLHAPGAARVDGRGMAAALRQAAAAAGWSSSTGRCTASSRRGGGARRVEARQPRGAPQRRRARALAVAGGAWTAAAGEWLGRATAGRTHEGADRASRRRGGDGRLAHRAAAAHALSRALARRSGGLRRARSRPGPASRSTVDGRRAPRAAARVPDRRARARRAPPTSRPGSGCARPRPTTAPLVGRVPGWAQRLGGHRPRRQRPVAGALLGPGRWPTTSPAPRSPADEAPLPAAFDPARFA